MEDLLLYGKVIYKMKVNMVFMDKDMILMEILLGILLEMNLELIIIQILFNQIPSITNLSNGDLLLYGKVIYKMEVNMVFMVKYMILMEILLEMNLELILI